MHLNYKIVRVLIINLMIFLISSCSKKEEISYVAKVGDSYLTEEELSKVISYDSDSTKFREAFIRKWIEEELLYLAAKEQGVVQSKEYKSLVENLDKRTANSILIKQIIKETVIDEDSLSIVKYFNSNPSEFKLTQPMIVYNYAAFMKYEEAEEFRVSLFQKNWDDAIDKVTKQNKYIYTGEEISSYIVETTHENYKELFNTLRLNRISRVMQTVDNQYRVFQLLQKYERNSIPNIKIIYESVKDRYIAKQRELAYKNYVKQLYSEHSSRIER